MAKAFILPFVVYLAGMSLAAKWSDQFPLLYSLTVLATLLVVIWSWRTSKAIVPHWKIIDAVLVGLVGIAYWIWISHWHLEATLTAGFPEWMQPSPRVAYDPFAAFSSHLAAWGFVSIRLLGLAVLVPIAEELFWRGFLMRWIVSEKWESVPIGTMTAASFWGVTLLFTLAHPEWFAAAGYCILLNSFLYWKKDLWKCVVAHGTSNLLLGVYVLSTGHYELW